MEKKKRLKIDKELGRRLLKGSIFRLLSLVNRLIPKRDDTILLYCAIGGIDFNLAPLLTYLLENGYQKNYRILCGVESLRYAKEDGCRYLTKMGAILAFFRSGHVFYTAGQIPVRPAKNQKVLHLQHGTTFKTTGALMNYNSGSQYYFTSLLETSELYTDIYARAFGCPADRIAVNSEPVTDLFFGPVEKYDLGSFEKVLLWTPTFRQSDYLQMADSDQEALLPCFENGDYEELNELLKRLDFKLIVKLHPSQSLSHYEKGSYSNLEILSGADFAKKGWQLYALLPQIDLLIADYSSLFLQFLLLDKPLAFAVPDLLEYRQKRGIVFDPPEAFMPGPILKDKESFLEMLKGFKRICEKPSEDPYSSERKRVKDLIHHYQDGRSCERLAKMSGLKPAGF